MAGRGDMRHNPRRGTDRGNEDEGRDPRDIAEIARLQQRVRDLELERDDHEEETESDPVIRDFGEDTVKPSSSPTPPPNPTRLERPGGTATSNPGSSRVTRCFKCYGLGHFARDCPNRHLVTLTEETLPLYDTDQDEDPENPMEILSPDRGESLITQRVLQTSAIPTTDNTLWLRNNIFRTRCTSKGKIRTIIIDGGSCENMVSVEMFMLLHVGLIVCMLMNVMGLDGLVVHGNINGSSELAEVIWDGGGNLVLWFDDDGSWMVFFGYGCFHWAEDNNGAALLQEEDNMDLHVGSNKDVILQLDVVNNGAYGIIGKRLSTEPSSQGIQFGSLPLGQFDYQKFLTIQNNDLEYDTIMGAKLWNNDIFHSLVKGLDRG
ncbi:hypothetical protein E3N88_29366 [Mikania micrantha]|uniref:CCHC-type domain-containing protein n=1 Tax=Mikania micrantha TaxID=192012 RepID=A0A5N6MJ13_9ASTR|nr:hypothetical protein E3N88_29366 [Mikania micrantha]